MQTLITILPWIQVILAVILVALILLQQSEGGLGSAFGGGEGSNSFKQKRGMEKIIFQATILISILFVLSTILALFV